MNTYIQKNDYQAVSCNFPDTLKTNLYQSMSYNLLNWMIKERCAICSKRLNCNTLQETLKAAGNNYPFQSVYWLIVSNTKWDPSTSDTYNIILCALFHHIQTNLFPQTSMQQQTLLLT